ncbi:hypothetical protein CXB51_014754 [Gossypium anomalum]|uniref:Uncharacterized protein n=1 Tax=Gossypium anomalum TaxID=47600 RepID=A0A8J5YYZ7_9ROSI|nr:hypothetical protein CXB51_014754 [Gossypium anomalum]
MNPTSFDLGPYGRTDEMTLGTWRPSVEISRVRPIFWCYSGLFQRLLAFSGC